MKHNSHLRQKHIPIGFVIGLCMSAFSWIVKSPIVYGNDGVIAYMQGFPVKYDRVLAPAYQDGDIVLTNVAQLNTFLFLTNALLWSTFALIIYWLFSTKWSKK